MALERLDDSRRVSRRVEQQAVDCRDPIFRNGDDQRRGIDVIYRKRVIGIDQRVKPLVYLVHTIDVILNI